MKEQEITRMLNGQKSPKPPEGLAEQIITEIPEELEVAPEIVAGPEITIAAATRSSFKPERIRDSTAALIVGVGTPRSNEFWEVHFPVPFCMASSRMRSTSGLLVSSSTRAKMSAVISIK